MGYLSRGPERKKSRVDPEGAGSTRRRQSALARRRLGDRPNKGGRTCSICRAGLCNASIRNARLAATGCGRAIPEENFAATVVRRFTMCRRRWAHACGCVPAPWADTVRWGVRQDVRDSRVRVEIGLARPGFAGTSCPRKNPRKVFGESTKQMTTAFPITA